MSWLMWVLILAFGAVLMVLPTTFEDEFIQDYFGVERFRDFFKGLFKLPTKASYNDIDSISMVTDSFSKED